MLFDLQSFDFLLIHYLNFFQLICESIVRDLCDESFLIGFQKTKNETDLINDDLPEVIEVRSTIFTQDIKLSLDFKIMMRL